MPQETENIFNFSENSENQQKTKSAELFQIIDEINLMKLANFEELHESDSSLENYWSVSSGDLDKSFPSDSEVPIITDDGNSCLGMSLSEEHKLEQKNVVRNIERGLGETLNDSKLVEANKPYSTKVKDFKHRVLPVIKISDHSHPVEQKTLSYFWCLRHNDIDLNYAGTSSDSNYTSTSSDIEIITTPIKRTKRLHKKLRTFNITKPIQETNQAMQTFMATLLRTIASASLSSSQINELQEELLLAVNSKLKNFTV